ncbi:MULTISPECIES: Flp family type IVb pilin [Dietzia]|jgi:pilus assembly protein Flp/PilA|uniref:Flp family type IVb pilin n=1 Tax=Dietzia TaxID=37914 RepID=UPI000BDF8D3B|nr:MULTISPECIES: Flp family type IVb pilin [unclassified Dietzia]MDV3353932.1 Flp family type IVb pilin [Dietzia sp. IN118]
MNQVYALMATFQAFLDDRFENRKDRGATAVEYGLMVGLIAVAIIAAVILLGDSLTDLFTDVSTTIPEVPAAGA